VTFDAPTTSIRQFATQCRSGNSYRAGFCQFESQLYRADCSAHNAAQGIEVSNTGLFWLNTGLFWSNVGIFFDRGARTTLRKVSRYTFSALLIEYRALLIKYRALLIKRRHLFWSRRARDAAQAIKVFSKKKIATQCTSEHCDKADFRVWETRRKTASPPCAPTFSKVSFIVRVYTELRRELTFENLRA